MNSRETERRQELQQAGEPLPVRRSVYVVPPDFDQTPDMEPRPRMDQYVTNYHIHLLIENLYYPPNGGFSQWAVENVELADCYFSPPYTPYAVLNLGYGQANILHASPEEVDNTNTEE